MLKVATKEKNSRWLNLFVVKKLKLYDGWSHGKGPFFPGKAKMIKKGEHSNPSFKLTNEMLFNKGLFSVEGF